MSIELEEYLSIQKCDCHRDYCEFFGGGVGEWGESFTREELEDMAVQLPKVTRHINKLLKDNEPED